MPDAVAELFDEMRSAVRGSIANHVQGDLFAGLPVLLDREGHQRAVSGATRPVVDDWLQAAVDVAPAPWRELGELLALATPALPWLRSYENLASSPELESFREFYSYQLFAGPLFRGHQPPILMDDVLVGFTLQAPNVLYPAHHHEPPEMYGIISGSLDWQVGEMWSTVGPGDVVVHRSHESHAMRSGDEPVLTWVAWPHNPNASVYMPSLDPADNTMEPTHYT